MTRLLPESLWRENCPLTNHYICVGVGKGVGVSAGIVGRGQATQRDAGIDDDGARPECRFATAGAETLWTADPNLYRIGRHLAKVPQIEISFSIYNVSSK